MNEIKESVKKPLITADRWLYSENNADLCRGVIDAVFLYFETSPTRAIEARAYETLVCLMMCFRDLRRLDGMKEPVILYLLQLGEEHGFYNKYMNTPWFWVVLKAVYHSRSDASRAVEPFALNHINTLVDNKKIGKVDVFYFYCIFLGDVLRRMDRTDTLDVRGNVKFLDVLLLALETECSFGRYERDSDRIGQIMNIFDLMEPEPLIDNMDDKVRFILRMTKLAQTFKTDYGGFSIRILELLQKYAVHMTQNPFRTFFLEHVESVWFRTWLDYEVSLRPAVMSLMDTIYFLQDDRKMDLGVLVRYELNREDRLEAYLEYDRLERSDRARRRQYGGKRRNKKHTSKEWPNFCQKMDTFYREFTNLVPAVQVVPQNEEDLEDADAARPRQVQEVARRGRRRPAAAVEEPEVPEGPPPRRQRIAGRRGAANAGAVPQAAVVLDAVPVVAGRPRRRGARRRAEDAGEVAEDVAEVVPEPVEALPPRRRAPRDRGAAVVEDPVVPVAPMAPLAVRRATRRRRHDAVRQAEVVPAAPKDAEEVQEVPAVRERRSGRTRVPNKRYAFM